MEKRKKKTRDVLEKLCTQKDSMKPGLIDYRKGFDHLLVFRFLLFNLLVMLVAVKSSILTKL